MYNDQNCEKNSPAPRVEIFRQAGGHKSPHNLQDEENVSIAIAKTSPMHKENRSQVLEIEENTSTTFNGHLINDAGSAIRFAQSHGPVDACSLVQHTQKNRKLVL